MTRGQYDSVLARVREQDNLIKALRENQALVDEFMRLSFEILDSLKTQEDAAALHITSKIDGVFGSALELDATVQKGKERLYRQLDAIVRHQMGDPGAAEPEPGQGTDQVTTSPTTSETTLDLGCGPNGKLPNSIGLDKRPAPHVDVVHNLNVYPYPFEDDHFDFIEMSHVIEHVDRPLQLMEEVHRIAKPGGTVRIITPHYSSQTSYGDLEHFHHFGYITFHTLQKTGMFRISQHKIHFTDLYRVVGIGLLANWFPRRWEKYACFMCPALYVEVFLEVVKGRGSGNGLTEDYMYVRPDHPPS